MCTKPTRVLVVDDSAVARQSISEHLNRDPHIIISSTARDPIVAERKIQNNTVDVILLDIEMPRMDGLSFLKSVKKRSSIPVVIFSAYSEQGSENAIKAMELGAVAVMCKPQGDEISETMEELAAILKGAAKVRKHGSRKGNERRSSNIISQQSVKEKTTDISSGNLAVNGSKLDKRIIAIGASTGGTDAVRDILMGLPNNCPPILVVIHMPKGFTFRFSQRLNTLCSIHVKEAENEEKLRIGTAYIAPGDQHLVLQKGHTGYKAVLQDGPRVKRHKPSVEVLFQSFAAVAKHNALGIILTGMGSDGADGLFEMHRMGAYTIAQNEETSIIFGMPKEAIKTGGVDHVLGLNEIPKYGIAWMQGSTIRPGKVPG